MNVFINYKMLKYDRIDISEDIDINKTNLSKELLLLLILYLKLTEIQMLFK